MGTTLFERELRTLSFVPRWVITRNIHTQSVAEHSFYVSIYALQLVQWLGGRDRNYRDKYDQRDLLEAALWHDAEECFTGDIPGPAKRNLTYRDRVNHSQWYILKGLKDRFGDQVPPITEPMRKVLKVANLLDEVLYKATEINMGNDGARHSYRLSHERLELAITQLDVSLENRHKLTIIVDQAIATHEFGQDRLPENNDDLAPDD